MFGISGSSGLRTLLSNGLSLSKTQSFRFNSTNVKPSHLLIKDINIKASSNSTGKAAFTLPQTRTEGIFNKSKQQQQALLNPAKSAAVLKTTGPIAGRIIHVKNGDITTAFRKLKNLVNINSIRFEHQQQRFHSKPGKVLEAKRIRRKKKLFDEGVRRLMNLVKEAKRRGY